MFASIQHEVVFCCCCFFQYLKGTEVVVCVGMLNLQAHDWKDKVSVLARDWHVLWKASPLLTVKVQS